MTPKTKTTSQKPANQTTNKPTKTTNPNTRSYKKYPVGKRIEIAVQVEAGNIIKWLRSSQVAWFVLIAATKVVESVKPHKMYDKELLLEQSSSRAVGA